MKPTTHNTQPVTRNSQRVTRNPYRAIVMGLSAGGTDLLMKMLPFLAADFSLPLIIVLHMHPDSINTLHSILNDMCSLTVKQAGDKEAIKPGVVYLAPPDYHLMIEDDLTFSLSLDEPVKYSRPSIDVLFETAADAFGADLIGVVMSGANSDGSDGLEKIKKTGGLAIVQQPATAEADVMPKAALAATTVDHVLAPEEIVPVLTGLAKGLIQ